MGLGAVFCDDTRHVGFGELAVDVVVDGADGRQTAAAYAARRKEGELTVGRAFAVLEAELLAEFIKDVARALDVASGAEADRNFVLAERV